MGGRSASKSVDLLIEGKTYFMGEFIDLSIAIDEGIIVGVSKLNTGFKPVERVRVSGKKLVLPGMVDIHVHMRDLNESYKEDWLSGSISAIKGGVTAVADMPNNKPYIDSIDKVLLKVREAESKSLVDFALYSGIPKKLSEEEVAGLRKLTSGFKVYPNDYGRVSELIVFLKPEDLLIIHPEDPAIILESMSKLELSVENHGLIRPPKAELSAIKRFLPMAERVRLHFTHITLPKSVKELIEAKMRGLKASYDVTIHHILLSEEIVDELGGIAKVNPPLRSREAVNGLFNAFKNGLVELLISDHAPHSLDEKLRSDYSSIPSGFPGLELCLPLLLTEIIDGRLPLKALETYSINPARFLGIAKGAIYPGYDGDLVIVDYGVNWIIKGSELSSKAKYTPFENKLVKARVRDVYLRGIHVLGDGEVLVGGGVGEPARRFIS